MAMDYEHVENIARAARKREAQLKVRVFELESQVEALGAELKELKASHKRAWDMIQEIAKAVDKLTGWRRDHLYNVHDYWDVGPL
jgi:septal ring factor EnvC (AmiA/AmiB activator)